MLCNCYNKILLVWSLDPVYLGSEVLDTGPIFLIHYNIYLLEIIQLIKTHQSAGKLSNFSFNRLPDQLTNSLLTKLTNPPSLRSNSSGV